MTGTIAAQQSVDSVTDLITPDSTMLLSSALTASIRGKGTRLAVVKHSSSAPAFSFFCDRFGLHEANSSNMMRQLAPDDTRDPCLQRRLVTVGSSFSPLR